ncbi:MAG TPA: rubrerythrin [Chloroflexi bacterium]|nr:rubrerythrin [Chloroflexota bacterium]
MKKHWDSVDEILDFAIKREEEAAAFYTNLAARVDKPWMQRVFEEFADEEKQHKAKLVAVKSGASFQPSKERVLDLKIADYLVSVTPTDDMSYQDALVVAMKKEKAAFKLYNDLASSTEDENVKTTFLALAQEEARHKLRFEVEYDDLLSDN